jgi:UDP-glucuronate 4-epimerase
MKVLVTGNAGFIGFHVAKRLLQRGDSVIGLDVVNDYYDVSLKEARLKRLEEISSGDQYTFIRGDLTDNNLLDSCFREQGVDRVIHLAAQAGVRYSLENPRAYIESNVTGFINILEACSKHSVDHLTYASSSSVYGANSSMPFREIDGVDHPLQIYAATKRSNELMAHSYSHLFSLPTTGLRFFTVYGPWGRPDMALFKFTKNILNDEPISVFNNGNHSRDFTYIDDVVEGVVAVNDNAAVPNNSWNSEKPLPHSSSSPFRIYNIGNGKPVKLDAYISAIESALGKQAIRNNLPIQKGDIPDTFADSGMLQKDFSYSPSVSVEEGVRNFVEWYREYYNV